MRIVGTDPRRTENRYRFLERSKCVETFDELSHDAQHAPRVGSGEVESGTRLLKELFVFGDRSRVANRVVDSSRYSRELSRTLLRWWSSSRLEVPFLGPL